MMSTISTPPASQEPEYDDEKTPLVLREEDLEIKVKLVEIFTAPPTEPKQLEEMEDF